ncbi:MAG: hypothetical protein A2901_01525 [Elusimicrobia bacterium RIFCSPLOWO2_01_FULL_54_10]|nr:MAG: hypothetical protein A2901_01525 [Elusimicrobia bacterium RIFCSPLOWO2_01_FULL_54_10]
MRVNILVVDDQASMRLTLKGILAKRGYEVYVAEDGLKALEEIKKRDYGLVIMDIKMPGLNGVDAYIKIKEINPKVPVIMMTAFALEDEIRRAIHEGAYAVLYKPFDMERILEVIGECIENKTLILLVDDSVEDRASYKVILERKGYKVMETQSGEECIKSIKERKFQVILLDLQLPGINGLETLKQIKTVRPDLPVIMVTGHSQTEMMENAMKSGSFAYLSKPVDITKLMEVISQTLDISNPSGGGKTGA